MREGCGAPGCRTAAAELAAWSAMAPGVPRYRAHASEAALKLPFHWRAQLELHRQAVHGAEVQAQQDRLLAQSGLLGAPTAGTRPGRGARASLARTDPTNPDEGLEYGPPVVDHYDPRTPGGGSPIGGRSDTIADPRDFGELPFPFHVPTPTTGRSPPPSGSVPEPEHGPELECPLGTIQLPDRSTVTRGNGVNGYAPGTISCFDQEYPGLGPKEWPRTQCPPPCLMEKSPVACDPPTGVSTVPVVPFEEVWLRSKGLVKDCAAGTVPLWGWVPVGALTPEESALLQSALLILQQNLDLIEWVACLARAWSPQDTPTRINDKDTLAGCLRNMLSRPPTATRSGCVVYVLAQMGSDCFGNDAGETAGATTANTLAETPDGNFGAIIPIRHEMFQRMLPYFLGRNGAGDSFCAAATLAGTILHELVHLCEDDTNPDCECEVQNDASGCCWEEQRMVASSFQWALAQRYPCLQTNAPHCSMGNVQKFMSSCEYAGLIP